MTDKPMTSHDLTVPGQGVGVTPAGSGCQPAASAAVASSRSGIPNAVETVAGALSAEFLFTREDADRIARVAIAAMREPTAAMVEASNREWDGRMSHRSSGAWQAMIDAALQEAGR